VLSRPHSKIAVLSFRDSEWEAPFENSPNSRRTPSQNQKGFKKVVSWDFRNLLNNSKNLQLQENPRVAMKALMSGNAPCLAPPPGIFLAQFVRPWRKHNGQGLQHSNRHHFYPILSN